MGEAFNREQELRYLNDPIFHAQVHLVLAAYPTGDSMAVERAMDLVDAILALPQPEPAFNREQVVEAARRVCGSLGPDVVDALEPFLALPQPEEQQCFMVWPSNLPKPKPVPQEDVTDEMVPVKHVLALIQSLPKRENGGERLTASDFAGLLVAALSREPGSSK